MEFDLDGVHVVFPFPHVYPEQLAYMRTLKQALDCGRGGHALLEMPTGTGKTVTLLAFLVAYTEQYRRQERVEMMHEKRTVVYCTRTVQEIDQVVQELSHVQAMRQSKGRNERFLGVCLSTRANLCINPEVNKERPDKQKVDALCRARTAPWVRQQRSDGEDVPFCEFYENMDKVDALCTSLNGVFSLEAIVDVGKREGVCPYFLARRLLAHADLIIYNYQYLLNPRIASLVSSELRDNSIVVFDEAHNIDNICIEAMSVRINRRVIRSASAQIETLREKAKHAEDTDIRKLQDAYKSLLKDLKSTKSNERKEQAVPSPLLPKDLALMKECLPGNIRKTRNFLRFLSVLVEHFKQRLSEQIVFTQTPSDFVKTLRKATAQDEGQTRALRFVHERLNLLMRTLEITETEKFRSLTYVTQFAALVSAYDRGFCVLMEPFDDRVPDVPDPVLQLCCLDASIAMSAVSERFHNVVITSGTLSPLEFYPQILRLNVAKLKSFDPTLPRECICPLLVSKGKDQVPISTRFQVRHDAAVLRNFGELLLDLSRSVPDGIVAFFVSYSYLEHVVAAWHESGVLHELKKRKLLFLETKDVVETLLALDAYKKACDSGRGAIFLSVARGKVAEGIDFAGHYGRAVVLFGVPFQYSLSRVLRERLRFLQNEYGVSDSEFMTFDALRQASQCVGRVIRNKNDYGLMIFADARYSRPEKREKLPKWIQKYITLEHTGLSTETAVSTVRAFCRQMAQPFEGNAIGHSLLDEKAATARLKYLEQQQRQTEAAMRLNDARQRQLYDPDAMIDDEGLSVVREIEEEEERKMLD